MSLNMYKMQYGLSQHNKFFKTLKFNLLCSKMSKCKVKCAGLHYIALS